MIEIDCHVVNKMDRANGDLMWCLAEFKQLYKHFVECLLKMAIKMSSAAS